MYISQVTCFTLSMNMSTSNGRYWCLEIPMPFMKLLCMALKLEFVVQCVCTKSEGYIFQRNNKFWLTFG
jgi:hypothetical protein